MTPDIATADDFNGTIVAPNRYALCTGKRLQGDDHRRGGFVGGKAIYADARASAGKKCRSRVRGSE